MARIVAEEKAASVTVADTPVAHTVSEVTGRRLPPRPSWWKGAEAATINNQVAAESLRLASKGKR